MNTHGFTQTLDVQRWWNWKSSHSITRGCHTHNIIILNQTHHLGRYLCNLWQLRRIVTIIAPGYDQPLMYVWQSSIVINCYKVAKPLRSVHRIFQAAFTITSFILIFFLHLIKHIVSDSSICSNWLKEHLIHIINTQATKKSHSTPTNVHFSDFSILYIYLWVQLSPSSSQWKPQRSQRAKRSISSRLQCLPRCLLPVSLFWTPPEKEEVSRPIYKEPKQLQLVALSTNAQRLNTEVSEDHWAPCIIWKTETSHPAEKLHLSFLNLQLCSCCHYSKPVVTMESQSKGYKDSFAL